MIDSESVKLEIFTPESALDAIRLALGALGVGRIGNYDYCCSITPVRGHWRPLPGSVPFEGEVGVVSVGTEFKLEVNCPASLVHEAISVVRQHHPYEEPLINVIPLVNHGYYPVSH